jgi:hypothetical protein
LATRRRQGTLFTINGQVNHQRKPDSIFLPTTCKLVETLDSRLSRFNPQAGCESCALCGWVHYEFEGEEVDVVNVNLFFA